MTAKNSSNKNKNSAVKREKPWGRGWVKKHIKQLFEIYISIAYQKILFYAGIPLRVSL